MLLETNPSHPLWLQGFKNLLLSSPGTRFPVNGRDRVALEFRVERLPQRQRSRVQPSNADEPSLIIFLQAGSPFVDLSEEKTSSRHAVISFSFTLIRQVPGSNSLPMVEWHHQRMCPSSPVLTVKGCVQGVRPFGPRLRMIVPCALGRAS